MSYAVHPISFRIKYTSRLWGYSAITVFDKYCHRTIKYQLILNKFLPQLLFLFGLISIKFKIFFTSYLNLYVVVFKFKQAGGTRVRKNLIKRIRGYKPFAYRWWSFFGKQTNFFYNYDFNIEDDEFAFFNKEFSDSKNWYFWYLFKKNILIRLKSNKFKFFLKDKNQTAFLSSTLNFYNYILPELTNSNIFSSNSGAQPLFSDPLLFSPSGANRSSAMFSTNPKLFYFVYFSKLFFAFKKVFLLKNYFRFFKKINLLKFIRINPKLLKKSAGYNYNKKYLNFFLKKNKIFYGKIKKQLLLKKKKFSFYKKYPSYTPRNKSFFVPNKKQNRAPIPSKKKKRVARLGSKKRQKFSPKKFIKNLAKVKKLFVKNFFYLTNFKRRTVRFQQKLNNLIKKLNFLLFYFVRKYYLVNYFFLSAKSRKLVKKLFFSKKFRFFFKSIRKFIKLGFLNKKFIKVNLRTGKKLKLFVKNKLFLRILKSPNTTGKLLSKNRTATSAQTKFSLLFRNKFFSSSKPQRANLKFFKYNYLQYFYFYSSNFYFTDFFINENTAPRANSKMSSIFASKKFKLNAPDVFSVSVPSVSTYKKKQLVGSNLIGFYPKFLFFYTTLLNSSSSNFVKKNVFNKFLITKFLKKKNIFSIRKKRKLLKLLRARKRKNKKKNFLKSTAKIFIARKKKSITPRRRKIKFAARVFGKKIFKNVLFFKNNRAKHRRYYNRRTAHWRRNVVLRKNIALSAFSNKSLVRKFNLMANQTGLHSGEKFRFVSSRKNWYYHNSVLLRNNFKAFKSFLFKPKTIKYRRLRRIIKRKRRLLLRLRKKKLYLRRKRVKRANVIRRLKNKKKLIKKKKNIIVGLSKKKFLIMKRKIERNLFLKSKNLKANRKYSLLPARFDKLWSFYRQRGLSSASKNIFFNKRKKIKFFNLFFKFFVSSSRKRKKKFSGLVKKKNIKKRKKVKSTGKPFLKKKITNKKTFKSFGRKKSSKIFRYKQKLNLKSKLNLRLAKMNKNRIAKLSKILAFKTAKVFKFSSQPVIRLKKKKLKSASKLKKKSYSTVLPKRKKKKISQSILDGVKTDPKIFNKLLRAVKTKKANFAVSSNWWVNKNKKLFGGKLGYSFGKNKFRGKQLFLAKRRRSRIKNIFARKFSLSQLTHSYYAFKRSWFLSRTFMEGLRPTYLHSKDFNFLNKKYVNSKFFKHFNKFFKLYNKRGNDEIFMYSNFKPDYKKIRQKAKRKFKYSLRFYFSKKKLSKKRKKIFLKKKKLRNLLFKQAVCNNFRRKQYLRTKIFFLKNARSKLIFKRSMFTKLKTSTPKNISSSFKKKCSNKNFLRNILFNTATKLFFKKKNIKFLKSRLYKDFSAANSFNFKRPKLFFLLKHKKTLKLSKKRRLFNLRKEFYYRWLLFKLRRNKFWSKSLILNKKLAGGSSLFSLIKRNTRLPLFLASSQNTLYKKVILKKNKISLKSLFYLPIYSRRIRRSKDIKLRKFSTVKGKPFIYSCKNFNYNKKLLRIRSKKGRFQKFYFYQYFSLKKNFFLLTKFFFILVGNLTSVGTVKKNFIFNFFFKNNLNSIDQTALVKKNKFFNSYFLKSLSSSSTKLAASALFLKNLFLFNPNSIIFSRKPRKTLWKKLPFWKLFFKFYAKNPNRFANFTNTSKKYYLRKLLIKKRVFIKKQIYLKRKSFARKSTIKIYYVFKCFEFIFSLFLKRLLNIPTKVYFTNVLKTLSSRLTLERFKMYQTFLLTARLGRKTSRKLRIFYYNFFNLYFYSIYFKNLILFLNFINSNFVTIKDQRRMVGLIRNLLPRCFITKIYKSIVGLKFLLTGKINKRPRSRTLVILFRRSAGNQTLDTKIYYAARQLFNKFGAFGAKLWLYSF